MPCLHIALYVSPGMIRQHNRQHRLSYRHTPQAHAGVMPSFGDNLGFMSVFINRFQRL